MTDFATTRAELEDMVSGIELSLGAQVYVSVDGETRLDVAAGDNGLGRPMRTDSVLALYCTTKPLLALAVALLEAQQVIDLEAPLGAVLPRTQSNDRVAAVGLRDILTHTAGLHQVQGIHANFVPARGWPDVVTSTPPAPGFRAGVDAAYSEWQGWTLLALAAEEATGRDCRSLVREEVIEPLGLAGELFLPMSPEEYSTCYERLGVNVDLRGAAPVPMLMERTERVCTAPNYAFGGYGSARAVGRFYQSLLQVRAGTQGGRLTGAVLARCASPARPRLYDQVLERECRFGLGFMVELADHDFSRACGAAAFGHSGNAGLSLGFADPDAGLAVGVVWNGLIETSAALGFRRRRIIDAIYQDLDLPTSDASAELELAGDRRGGRWPWRSR